MDAIPVCKTSLSTELVLVLFGFFFLLPYYIKSCLGTSYFFVVSYATSNVFSNLKVNKFQGFLNFDTATPSPELHYKQCTGTLSAKILQIQETFRHEEVPSS